MLIFFFSFFRTTVNNEFKHSIFSQATIFKLNKFDINSRNFRSLFNLKSFWLTIGTSIPKSEFGIHNPGGLHQKTVTFLSHLHQHKLDYVFLKLFLIHSVMVDWTYSYGFSDNFLSSIPISDWLIFCYRILIFHQKKNWKW